MRDLVDKQVGSVLNWIMASQTGEELSSPTCRSVRVLTFGPFLHPSTMGACGL